MKNNNLNKKVVYDIDTKWAIVNIRSVEKRSSDFEKAYAINEILNNVFFNEKVWKDPGLHSRYSREGELRNLYKFRPVFVGEIPNKLVSYSMSLTMLAMVVLKLPKVENENEIVTSLRENYKKIKEFSEDDTLNEMIITSCSIKFQKWYKELLRHILVSDKDAPKNINNNNFIVPTGNLTYRITKINLSMEA